MKNAIVIVVGLAACVTAGAIAAMFFDPPLAFVISGLIGAPIGIAVANLVDF